MFSNCGFQITDSIIFNSFPYRFPLLRLVHCFLLLWHSARLKHESTLRDRQSWILQSWREWHKVLETCSHRVFLWYPKNMNSNRGVLEIIATLTNNWKVWEQNILRIFLTPECLILKPIVCLYLAVKTFITHFKMKTNSFCIKRQVKILLYTEHHKSSKTHNHIKCKWTCRIIVSHNLLIIYTLNLIRKYPYWLWLTKN